MNGLPYYKAYPRDFFEGTIGMPLEMKGPYRLVIDLIYMQGGKLPDDPRYISGLLGCSVKLWNKIRSYLIENRKIEVRGDFLGNLRADDELESLTKLQQRQRENASGPRKNNDLEKPSQNHTEPEPDIEKREPNGSPKKDVRGSRLPDDWRLPKEWGQWAVEQGVPEVTVRQEADRFRDYWSAKAGKDATKLDWQATWRNWVRNWLDRNQPRQSTPQGDFWTGKVLS